MDMNPKIKNYMKKLKVKGLKRIMAIWTSVQNGLSFLEVQFLGPMNST